MHRKASMLLRISIHVLSCIAFLLIPILASPRASLFDWKSISTPELRGLISSGLLIILFYLNYYLFIPLFFRKKQFYIWFLLASFAFLLILFLSQTVIPDRNNSFNRPHPHPRSELREGGSNSRIMLPPMKPVHKSSAFKGFQLIENVLKFLIVYGLSLLLRTNEWWRQSREEKRKAELESLKLQVNPHFLFNTLNGIYALALEKSEKTSEAIIRLSGLMRYNISEIQKDMVPLKNEIDYLRDYIDLQRMRLENTVNILFDAENINPDMPIAPLLLISFVENAFKYGINPEQVSEIFILISCARDTFLLQVINEKVHVQNSDLKNETGIVNVRRRLDLLYPDQHELNITETDNKYVVELKLVIK